MVLASCLGLKASNESIEGKKLSPFFYSVSFWASTSATFQRLRIPDQKYFTELVCRIISSHPLNFIPKSIGSLNLKNQCSAPIDTAARAAGMRSECHVRKE